MYRNSVGEEVIGGIKPNCLARIYPDGRVLVSRRMKVQTKIARSVPILERESRLSIASCEFDTLRTFQIQL